MTIDKDRLTLAILIALIPVLIFVGVLVGWCRSVRDLPRSMISYIR